jgi:Flp pilus assembly protein TadG
MKPKRQHGATAVEFALVMPVLLLLLFGIVQFGWLMNNYIVLTNAASTGARLLATERGYATPYTDTKSSVLAATSTLNNKPTITVTVGSATCVSTSSSCGDSTFASCSGSSTCVPPLGTTSQPATSGTMATVTLSYAFVPPFNGSLYGLNALMPPTLTASASVAVQ